jgi:hypothetical protein
MRVERYGNISSKVIERRLTPLQIGCGLPFKRATSVLVSLVRCWISVNCGYSEIVRFNSEKVYYYFGMICETPKNCDSTPK